MGDLSWAVKNGDLEKVKESIDTHVSQIWKSNYYSFKVNFHFNLIWRSFCIAILSGENNIDIKSQMIIESANEAVSEAVMFCLTEAFKTPEVRYNKKESLGTISSRFARNKPDKNYSKEKLKTNVESMKSNLNRFAHHDTVVLSQKPLTLTCFDGNSA